MATLNTDKLFEARSVQRTRGQFEEDFSKANVVVQIESMRLVLLAMLERVRGDMELQEVEQAIEGLWSFSTDELFGFSASKIQRQDYSIEHLTGIYGILRVYQDKWADRANRRKTYYMSAGVVALLDVIRYNLSANRGPAEFAIEMIKTAAYALQKEDPQIVSWFFVVFMEAFYATRDNYEASIRT